MLGSCHTGHYKRYDGNAIKIRYIRHDTGLVHRRRSTQTIYFSTNMSSDEEDNISCLTDERGIEEEGKQNKVLGTPLLQQKWVNLEVRNPVVLSYNYYLINCQLDCLFT